MSDEKPFEYIDEYHEHTTEELRRRLARARADGPRPIEPMQDYVFSGYCGAPFLPRDGILGAPLSEREYTEEHVNPDGSRTVISYRAGYGESRALTRQEYERAYFPWWRRSWWWLLRLFRVMR